MADPESASNKLRRNGHHTNEIREKKVSDAEDVLNNERAETSVEQKRKLIKRLVCFLVFIIILGTSVLSKLSLLFMISHIGKNRIIPYCDVRVQSSGEKLFATIPDEQRIDWMFAIVLAYGLPELVTLFKAWLASYHVEAGDEDRSGFIAFTVVFCVETLHVIGMGLLIFVVLPNLNVIQSVLLTNCLCLIPALLNVFSDGELDKSNQEFNILAFFTQMIGFIVWPWMSENSKVWCFPIATILISFHWWENFVPTDTKVAQLMTLNKLKIMINKTRANTLLFVSPWKIFLFLNCAIYFSNISLSEFLKQCFAGWKSHWIGITAESTNVLLDSVLSSPSSIYWTLLIQVTSSFVCYVFAQFACKAEMQRFSFALPLNLTVPASIAVVLVVCVARASNVCIYHNIVPDYLFFISPVVYNLRDFLFYEYGSIWIFWMLSQAWITRHIWIPNSNKDESKTGLFITPMYGLINDQSLLLNRRRYNRSKIKGPTEGNLPQVYVCATMWHEEEVEMIVFLESILRLDTARCAFSQSNKHDTFEMETHIFFDDASTNDDDMNAFVVQFVDSLSKAVQKVYNPQKYIAKPVMRITPYGSRLEYKLPQTDMFVHLKNSVKIRKKKRWSQVMYMRYLLEYRIIQQRNTNTQNTFILALDGDIDFQPEAVHLLINRMKADDNLGAACGRIYPIGSGPIVWYQQFEYAIGHWLQKATEHVIGCVLCSPGCFSLFRASAFTDDNDDILNKYSAEAKKAEQFVQYDQGEDRWLCTLILKAGKRIEYSAAAKAYTHCPKTFKGIFKQRLRWITSTIANNIDFLRNSREIIRKNKNISVLFIVYQMLLFIGTILGPGTIFLMMVGSIASVFDIDLLNVFLWNLIPIVGFMIVCHNRKHQITVAIFLSGIYSLVMMTVLIAMIIQFIRHGLVSPSSVFFILIIGQILIAGLLHPGEFGCILYGILYYMSIPTMYNLLIIYAIFNMNDLSWGTREDSNVEETDNSIDSRRSHSRGLFICLCCSNLEMTTSETSSTTSLPDNTRQEPGAKSPKPERSNHGILVNGDLEEHDFGEFLFWKRAIQKLTPQQPLSKDQLALDELRDTCVFSFVLLNTMFVLIVYACQLNKDYFYIQWPFGSKYILHFDDTTHDIKMVREYSQVEPLGVLFVGFFGVILIIQFIAMLVHRFSTLSEMLASTELGWNWGKKVDEIAKYCEFCENNQKPKCSRKCDSNGEKTERNPHHLGTSFKRNYKEKNEKIDV